MKPMFSLMIVFSLFYILKAKAFKEVLMDLETNLWPKSDVKPITTKIFFSTTNRTAIDFIRRQSQNEQGAIWNLMMKGSNELNLQFIPSVKKVDQNYECEDMDNNCFETRLLACALKMDTTVRNSQLFHFIVCSVSHNQWTDDSTQAVVQCMKQVCDWMTDGKAVVDCANNRVTSDPYLDYMIEETERYNVTKDLAVFIEDHENESAIDNLLGAVCHAYEGSKPTECQTMPTPTPSTPPTSPTPDPTVNPLLVKIFLTPTNQRAIDFVKRQQNSEENGIWELMLNDQDDLYIDFYPWGTAVKHQQNGTHDCPDDEGCVATRLLACAVKLHATAPDNVRVFRFMVCTITHNLWTTDPEKAVLQCDTEWPEEGQDIVDCAHKTSTSNLFLDAMKGETDRHSVNKDLAVFIKDQDNEDAIDYLFSAVCNAYEGNKPKECINAPIIPTTTTTTIASISTSESSETLTPQDPGSSTTTTTLKPSQTPSTTSIPDPSDSAQDIISNKLFGFSLIVITMIAIL